MTRHGFTITMQKFVDYALGLVLGVLVIMGDGTIAYASPSLAVAPSSGPVNTLITLTLSAVQPLTTVFVRFDGSDYPEWQKKADEKGSAVFSSSLYRFPSQTTKGAQKISIAKGLHSIGVYAQGVNGKLLASAEFTVVDPATPPKLIVTPSAGPVGTKITVRAINTLGFTAPRLALQDGIEQVTYQELKKQIDGSWAGTYTIPKEVVKHYDPSGKPVIIPIQEGGHTLMFYEKTAIVFAPFTVTKPASAPAPEPIATPKPAPDPTQNAQACDPNMPSYSQPGCKKTDAPSAEQSSGSASTACDPTIPRYGQAECQAPSVSEKPRERPAEQKPTCNPDIPSYAQIGCILGESKKSEKSPAEGQSVPPSSDDQPAEDIDTVKDGTARALKALASLQKIVHARQNSLRFFGIHTPELVRAIQTQIASLNAITQLITVNKMDEAVVAYSELDEFDAPALTSSILLIQKNYAILKKVSDKRIKKELSDVMSLIAISVNEGDYGDAYESLAVFAKEIARNKNVYLSKKISKNNQKKIKDILEKLQDSLKRDATPPASTL